MNHKFNNLTISLVDHCNYNCNNCMHFTMYRLKKEYLSKDFIPSIKLMIDQNIISNQEITLAGGEPFLHSNIQGFVENLLYDIDLPIDICSNGFWVSKGGIDKYYDMIRKIKRLTITQYKPFNVNALLAIEELKKITKVVIISRIEFAAPTFSSIWTEPIIPKVALTDNDYCRFVDCIQLLADGRLMKCPTGYAGMSIFPTSKEFRDSKHMFYNLNNPLEEFKTWWNRYPFDACYYCRLNAVTHSFGNKFL